MNKTILTIALFSASTVAMAASNNTITFQGEVAAQTCSVTINGNQANAVVLLPTVSTGELAVAGATAGKTTFTLGVAGCTAEVSDTEIKTVFVGNDVTPAGNLGNSGSATNVEIQLLENESTTVGMNLTGGQTTGSITLPAAATSAEQNFAVQYYSTGPATPGSVIASVQYAVSYL